MESKINGMEAKMDYLKIDLKRYIEYLKEDLKTDVFQMVL